MTDHMTTTVTVSYLVSASSDSGGSTQSFPTTEWDDAVERAEGHVARHPDWHIAIYQQFEATVVSQRLWEHKPEPIETIPGGA